jgi:Fe2+ or Zn2+ uptake regulation protein
MVGKLIAMLFSNIVLMFFDNFICKFVMQNEEVGVATIYRVLTQFEASGMVNKLNFDNGL